jgi:hypothetical protein
LPHCLVSASATTPKVTIAKSICKPEDSDLRYTLTFSVINWPYDCSVFVSSSTHQNWKNRKRNTKCLSWDGRLCTVCCWQYRST